jgi:hypothetical protein
MLERSKPNVHREVHRIGIENSSENFVARLPMPSFALRVKAPQSSSFGLVPIQSEKPFRKRIFLNASR